LVPGDAREMQGDLPLDVVRGGNVDAACLGEQAQHAEHVGILQVERDAPAGVAVRPGGGPGGGQCAPPQDEYGDCAAAPAHLRPPAALDISSTTADGCCSPLPSPGSRMRSQPRPMPTTTPPRGPTGVPIVTM